MQHRVCHFYRHHAVQIVEQKCPRHADMMAPLDIMRAPLEHRVYIVSNITYIVPRGLGGHLRCTELSTDTESSLVADQKKLQSGCRGFFLVRFA